MIFQNEVAFKGQQVVIFRSGYQVCECSYATALIFADSINKD